MTSIPIQHIPYYLANILTHIAVYIFFIVYPFKSKLKYGLSKTITGIVIYIIFTCNLVLLFFEQEAPFPQYGIYALVIWIAVSIIGCKLLIRENTFQLCFLILVTFNIQNNIIKIARIIDSFNIFPRFAVFEHTNYLLITVGVLILYLPVMWYIYINLFKKVIDTGIDFAYWKYLCILPASNLAFLHINWLDNFYPSNAYEIQDLLSLVFLIIIGILAYTVSLEMLIKTHESLLALSQAHFMTMQLNLQKGEYERLMEKIRQTARQHHDWRHHLLTIGGFIQNKNYEMLESYFSNYMSTYLADDEIPICNNAIADIVLRHFISYAKEQDIEVITDVNIPAALEIPDLDLCVVFGNLVENALEACALQKTGRRFIKIKASVIGEQLFIFIQNSFSVPVKQIDGIFYSSKRKGEGIGISSVKNIAESNGGSFRVSVRNDTFTVDVLLNV